jgi:hypothetical protein
MISRAILGFALALSVGGAAAAQVSVRCHDTYAGAPQLGQTCEGSGPSRFSAPAAAAPVYSWKDVKPKACSAYEKLALGSQQCDAREIAVVHKTVGDLIAAGDCAQALKTALGTGDLEFARQVRDFCPAK